MKYVITGVFGFLGHGTALRMLQDGHAVLGIDRLNNAVSAKEHRVAGLRRFGDRFHYRECDISDYREVSKIMLDARPEIVIHFAAQYSVPHSTSVMHNYIRSNLAGFLYVCEAAKNAGVRRIVYASSTWVSDHAVPWTMYGASKQFNESAANIYSRQFDIETIGLRYGSTFGPMCRSDVGPYMVARRLFNRETHSMEGAYDYKVAFLDMDDAVGATLAAANCELPAKHNVATVVADDNHKNLADILMYYAAETGLQPKLAKEYKCSGSGKAPNYECQRLHHMIGYRPCVNVKQASIKFINWFKKEWEAGNIR